MAVGAPASPGELLRTERGYLLWVSNFWSDGVNTYIIRSNDRHQRDPERGRDNHNDDGNSLGEHLNGTARHCSLLDR